MKLEMGPTNLEQAFEVLFYLSVFLMFLIMQAHISFHRTVLFLLGRGVGLRLGQ